MKISDQGFTERLPAQVDRAASTSAPSGGSSSGISARTGSSDGLQLSSLASRLQSASSSDAQRSSRITQITSAVQSNTFKIDPAQISKAMVSEAVQSSAR